MSLDQFYTKPNIAIICVKQLFEQIHIDNFDFFLEPSCGTGNFFNLLPENKRIGIDLDPKIKDINVLQSDFYHFIPNQNKRYCVVGNPPFGRVCSDAVKFFNKAAEFADVIAFIIPKTFRRISIQNRLNLYYILLFESDIPMFPCSFEPKMGAKCCFQIWKRVQNPRQKIILNTTHSDWKFLSWGAPKKNDGQPTPPKDADFALKAYGSNCGEIIKDNLNELSPKSWHWIKSNIKIDLLIHRFSTLDYSVSKNTVRQESIGAGELVMLYSQIY